MESKVIKLEFVNSSFSKKELMRLISRHISYSNFRNTPKLSYLRETSKYAYSMEIMRTYIEFSFNEKSSKKDYEMVTKILETLIEYIEAEKIIYISDTSEKHFTPKNYKKSNPIKNFILNFI